MSGQRGESNLAFWRGTVNMSPKKLLTVDCWQSMFSQSDTICDQM